MCQSTTAAARPFVVTPYLPNDDGELCPSMPAYGPCGLGDEGACRLVLDHHRPRTTGPCFPLAVLRCTVHGCGFTLYPPGHVPYGRRAVAPVATDGSRVRVDDADDVKPHGAGREEPDEQAVSPEALAFSGTMFDAALDAARGRIWQRDHLPGGTDRWWSTQGRWIERALRLLGLGPDQSVALRHEVAELLAVDTLMLHELASMQLGEQAGYRQRGQAICQVLAALPLVSAFLAERLCNCGHLCGLWGMPLRWEPQARALRQQPFRLVDTRAPP